MPRDLTRILIPQDLCEEIKGPVRFRGDIGTKELIQKKIEMVRAL